MCIASTTGRTGDCTAGAMDQTLRSGYGDRGIIPPRDHLSL
jgi:hypothetical protein